MSYLIWPTAVTIAAVVITLKQPNSDMALVLGTFISILAWALAFIWWSTYP